MTLLALAPTLMCLKRKQEHSENWLNAPLEVISFMGQIYFHFTLKIKQ